MKTRSVKIVISLCFSCSWHVRSFLLASYDNEMSAAACEENWPYLINAMDCNMSDLLLHASRQDTAGEYQ